MQGWLSYMTIKEFLEQDKERLLSRLASAGKTEDKIRIMEDEMDRILLKAGEEWKDGRVDVLQGMLTTAKAALPVLDSTGEVKIYDRRESDDEKAQKGARKKRGALMLLLGAALAGISFTIGAAVHPEGLQTVFYALLGVMQAGGVVSAAVGGGLLKRSKGTSSKDQIIDVTLDADKIYHHMSLLGSVMDQQLEETLSLPAPKDEGTDEGTQAVSAASGTAAVMDKAQLQLFSGILEAAYSEENSEFAGEIVSEVKFYLHQAGIEALDAKSVMALDESGDGWKMRLDRYFDRMPGAENRTLRPALVKDGQVLVKGLYAEGSGRA